MKWWLNAIDEVRREKFGGTEDMRYDSWRRQKRLRVKDLLFLIGFGLALLLLWMCFPDAVNLYG